MKKLISNLILVLAFFLAMNSDAQTAYVTDGHNSVWVINAATNTSIASIPVGFNPMGVSVSPDGTKVYITNNSDNPDTANTGNTVSVINTATNTVSNTITNSVTASITVGTAPNGIAVTPDGTKLYIANGYDSTVSVINTNTNTVI